MKKLFLLIGILFLIQLINAEVIPLTIFSDKEYLGSEQWRFTSYSIPQYYFNDLNKLETINNNWQNFYFNDWRFINGRGLYSIMAKSNGTIGFRYKNKGLNLQLDGIGFYNTQTQEKIVVDNAFLSNPDINGNELIFDLPLENTYRVVHENKKFRDILVINQTTKNYLWNNLPQGWSSENTWFGLIFSMAGYNINLNNFDSNKIINFKDGNKTIFKLPPSKVYHENHYSGEGNVDNTGLEWQKKRVYFNGNYIEVIPVSALQSIDGNLIFNTTIELEVTNSTDDAQETLLGIDLTNVNITFSTNENPAGVIFRDVDVPQGVTVSESLLNISYAPNCSSATCTIKWYGIDQDDTNTWSATHKPGSEAKTTATITQTENTDFTPNSAHAHKDLNMTTLVQEILDRGGWVADNNMGFILNIGGSYARGKSVIIKTFDASSDSWTFTIEHSGPEPNPCQPNLDEDWVFSNTTLHCFEETIVLGTGNLYLDKDSLLGLISSSLFANNLISIEFPDFNKTQLTQTADVEYSSHEFGSIASVAHPTEGSQQHAGGMSTTTNGKNPFIGIDLGETHFIRDVSFALSYSFGRFSDLNIVAWTGSEWELVWEDSSFEMAVGVGQDDCDWNGSNGAWYYCDINRSVNLYASKIRLNVDSDSNSEGELFDFNALGMAEIFIMADDPRKRNYIQLNDSNFNIT